MLKRLAAMIRSERDLPLELRRELVDGLFYPFASMITGALAGLWIAATVTLLIDDIVVTALAEAHERAASLRQYGLYWLEEPIFPPENFKALAALQEKFDIPIAAGENACTSFEFEKMFEVKAVRYAQPSVTKVGGVTELRKVASQCSVAGVHLMPHSPYFGPGFLATLHLAVLEPANCMIERFYLTPEASLYGKWIDPTAGAFDLPEGPGLGLLPDPDVIREYRVGV